MFSKSTLLMIAALTTSILTSHTSFSFGQQLGLDTQIESPPQNNNALELPEKQAGETIQFQLFIQGAAGRQIQGYTVELALKGKTFGSYIDDVSGTDLNGGALLSRVTGTGNPTLSMLSLAAVAIPASGYLGQVNLSVSRALTLSDSLTVQSASIAGAGGVQNMDVSQAVLTFSEAPGEQLPLILDAQIESPAQNNNALTVPEKRAGDTFQFQLFAPGAAGDRIQGYTVELALQGKTFGGYFDDVSGADLNGNALLTRVSETGNTTLSMLSLSAVAIPISGYLGQVNLSVSRALTSSDSLSVQSASIAGSGGLQNMDVSQAVLTFTRASGPKLRMELDTQIETPAQNNNVLELPEKRAGDSIQFQLFVSAAAGQQIEGIQANLALRGKRFGDYIDDLSWTGTISLLLEWNADGTFAAASIPVVAIPSSGFLGQVTLRVSRALTSSDMLTVRSALIAAPGGVQDLDVSQAVLTFTEVPRCPGDFNGDGMVDFADFIALAQVFGAESGDPRYDARMDMDRSGELSFGDFVAFASVFGTSC